jgi:pimeloyl-ACP methyl ester carboxylesterase
VRAFLRFRIVFAVTALIALVACDQSDEIRRQALEDSSAVTFPSPDGIELAGRIFGPDTATAGVVLAHMLPADQSSWFDFADRLAGAGYRVLTFDFRGYCPGGAAGCSEGEKDVAASWQDVQGAVDYLRSQGVRQVGLVGASMGGTASLVVAGEQGDGIDAVITLSAPDAIDGLAASPETLQRVTAAKLFLAGQSDGTAADVAQRFYDEGLPPKRVEILTTGDHGTDLLTGNQAEIARNLILSWLAQHLPA